MISAFNITITVLEKEYANGIKQKRERKRSLLNTSN